MNINRRKYLQKKLLIKNNNFMLDKIIKFNLQTWDDLQLYTKNNMN